MVPRAVSVMIGIGYGVVIAVGMNLTLLNTPLTFMPWLTYLLSSGFYIGLLGAAIVACIHKNTATSTAYCISLFALLLISTRQYDLAGILLVAGQIRQPPDAWVPIPKVTDLVTWIALSLLVIRKRTQVRSEN